MAAKSIGHISVDDHYCYIHYRDGEFWSNTDAAQPLKDIKNLLPESLLHVHRSHIINPQHTNAIEKDNRTYSLQLASGHSLPISKQRINQVLRRGPLVSCRH
jgi:DNA-binding LytR/AlgR family response regulator